MRMKAPFLLIVVLLLTTVSVATAQEDPLVNTYDIATAGVTLHFPDGWSVELAEDESFYLTSGNADYLPNWYFPENFGDYGMTADNIASAFSYRFSPLDPSVTFNPSALTMQTIDGRQVYVYEYQDSDNGDLYQVVMTGVVGADGTYYIAEAYPNFDSALLPDELNDVLRITAAVEIEPLGITDIPDATEASEVDDVTTTDGGYEFFETDIVVDLPAGWADYLDENEFLTLESDLTVFEPYWYFVSDLTDMGLIGGDVSSVLANLAERLELGFDPSLTNTVLLGGKTLTTAPYTLTDSNGVSYDALMAGIELEDGTVLIGFIYPLEGSLLEETDAALGILASARIQAPDDITSSVPLSESFEFEGTGITIHYPASWTQADDEGFIYFHSDATIADPYYVLAADLQAQGITPGDLAGGIQSLTSSLYEEIPFDPSAVVSTTYEGQQVAVYPFNDEDDAGIPYVHLFTATMLDNGAMFFIDAYPVSESEIQEPEIVLSMTIGAEGSMAPRDSRRSTG